VAEETRISIVMKMMMTRMMLMLMLLMLMLLMLMLLMLLMLMLLMLMLLMLMLMLMWGRIGTTGDRDRQSQTRCSIFWNISSK